MTTPERWRQIEVLYEAALAREGAERTSFLEQACGADPGLRREIESLLEADREAGAFIETPVADVVGTHRVSNLLVAGQQIGPYRIESLLGAGGMGEVYKAHDPRLGRDVAIKVLPASLSADADRLRRFHQEARAAATLAHPNIVALYDVGADDDRPYIVSAFLEGETLREVLVKGMLPISKALDYGTQVANGLDAAHEQGIVHRDLKPENLFIVKDGRVKILDFGLAKLTQPQSVSQGPLRRATAPNGTIPGTVLGTAGYMSPEQVRGQPVDKRTDIWSFGCVLYEILSGRAAFPGGTISDMVAAILSRDPDWGALPPTTPASVHRLLRQCLDKDPKQRLRDIGDARIDLRDARGALGSSADIPLPPRRVGRAWWWAAAASVSAAMLLAIALVLSKRESAEASWQNPLANARVTRLTDFEGAEHDAAISPDGKFVAFRADRDGPFDVWLGQMGTGRYLNLTHGQDDEMRLGLRSVGFSFDGSEIWLSGGPDRRLRLMPLMGGTPRVFLGEAAVNIAWSPDGARLAYHTRQNGDPLYVADRNGANARLIFVNPKGPGGHTHYPTWSPDGHWIYFVTGIAAISNMDLWRIPSIGGTPERLTYLNTDVAYPTPIDDHTVLYVAPDPDGSGPWIWVLDLERRTPHRATIGLENYTSLMASADGRRLVATVANPSASLWTIPILDLPVDERDAKPFPLPTVNPTMPRFGGRSLFYLSLSGVGNGLWRYQEGQAVEIWKGADGTLLAPPSVSADGRRVAMALRRDGRLRLHVLSADGAELQALTEAIDVHGATCWSPDGQWIVAGGDAADGPGLFKVPVSGGAPTRLVKRDAYHPVWSSDGRIIVYVGETVAPYSPLLAVSPDGAPVTLPPIRLRYGSGNAAAPWRRQGMRRTRYGRCRRRWRSMRSTLSITTPWAASRTGSDDIRKPRMPFAKSSSSSRPTCADTATSALCI